MGPRHHVAVLLPVLAPVRLGASALPHLQKQSWVELCTAFGLILSLRSVLFNIHVTSHGSLLWTSRVCTGNMRAVGMGAACGKPNV